jgi:predicted nucleic acid-binding protein
VDTGWVIAAEKDPTGARRHIAALTRVGQVLVLPPEVLVEARQRAADLGKVDAVLARLRCEAVLPEDGLRASELLRRAGEQSRDASARIREIGVVDAIVAAFAERMGGIVYTDNPQHMQWLVAAGAGITPEPTPF